RPQLAEGGRGFADEHMDSVAAMLTNYLAQERIERYGVWFYTPMALPLLRQLDPEVIVYDCMDELSGFKNAPAQLVARENTLLKISNLVFTGGPSLYDAKRDRNADTHCFPSSVEAAHFQTAASPAIAGERFQSIPGPRLGFYGVIDERLDIELVARLAAARSDWQICLVGPVVKIDPASLPQAPNLHYFPQQSYEELPRSLAAWDLCLLPFALNESTRFISPTKTLEYMCASKPIVSTAIADVSRLYGDGVSVAHDHDQFIAACSALLEETAEQARARAERQAALVETTSWDRTAEAMTELVFAAAEQGLTTPARNYLDRPQVVGLPLKDSGSHREIQVDCLIAGAGPTGLSAAYHLGQSSLLIEANDEVGGWCRSIEDKGFTFDYAGHIMFSKDPYVLDLYEKLLGDNLHWQDREAWVYSKGVHTRYPFQGALHGLPPEVLKECLVGAIEARFGSLDGVAQLAPSGSVPANAPVAPTDCCADGVVPDTTGEGDVKDQMPSTVANFPSGKGPRNFEEFIYQVWGKGVAKHFAVPYNLKLWTVPLQEMETSWLGGRVPLPDLEEMIDGALTPVSKPVGPNARFGYPLRGGFQALMTGFLPHLRGQLRLSTRLVGIDIAAHAALLSDGSRVRYGSLISTLPLPELVRIIGDEAPGYVQRAASALRHVSVRCVNLGIARPALTNKHWIYYPEQTVFHRIFVQGNASPHNNPEQGFGLTCEITYSPTKPLPCDGQELIDRCIRECREVGMLSAEDEVITGNIVDMPYAYVIYDHARADNVARIRSWLASRDIVLAGRYSEWEYYNSDHAFIAGKNAAENVMAAEQARGQRA
ncbi:MAG: FAD-dependent oxidoreductase, partial [Pseudoxanthomonas sp.]